MTEINQDDVDDLKSQSQQSQNFPDHWSLFLHCTICFGFFHNPHTLECGHSFCKRCLKRLAEISRDDNPDIRLRRLCVSCPACRHPFRAKPAIRGRIRTCIVLKHLVDLWKQECKILLSSSPRQLRSICSQTDTDDAGDIKKTEDQPLKTEVQTPNLHEEFSVRLPPGDDYFEAVMRRVSEASGEIDQDPPDEKIGGLSTFLHAAGHLDVDRSNREINSSSDSESSVSSSGDEIATAMVIAAGGGRGGGGVGGAGGGGNADASAAHQTGSNRSLSNVSIPEFFGHMSVSVSMFRSCEWFPVRCLLMTVWFVYSLLIVALAEAFLPYVMIFTLFFFLVVLK